MSYNPSGPVSVTRVAQPRDHSFSLNGIAPDHSSISRAYPNSALEAAKRRKLSKDQLSAVFDHPSSTTPHMRALSLGESSPISPNSDKRRNKLGYHRTSVACGHCRRRKIRCLLAPDDVQGRCANCIRLKKECNFYPVEQQGSVESRAQPSKRGSVTHIASSSSSSSPRNPNPAGHENIEEYGAFQHLPTGEPPPGHSVPHLDGPIEMKPHPGGVIPQSDFPYSPSFDFNGWAPNYSGHTPSDGQSEASSVACWPPCPPVSSASPFHHDQLGIPGQTSHEVHAPLPPHHFPPHEQSAYPGLQRSMSYGGPESFAQDPRFQHGLPVHSQRHSAHEMPPVDHGHDPGSINHAGYVPQNWQPYVQSAPEGTQPGPVQPFTGHWYPEPPGLGSVEEEHNLASPYRQF